MTDHDDFLSPPEPDQGPISPDADEPAAPRRSEPPPANTWRLGLFLLLAVLVVVFAVQNTQNARLHFLGWSWELPLVIILLAAVVVSVVLDEVLGTIVKRRRRSRREEREELRRLRDQS